MLSTPPAFRIKLIALINTHDPPHSQLNCHLLSVPSLSKYIYKAYALPDDYNQIVSFLLLPQSSARMGKTVAFEPRNSINNALNDCSVIEEYILHTCLDHQAYKCLNCSFKIKQKLMNCISSLP